MASTVIPCHGRGVRGVFLYDLPKSNVCLFGRRTDDPALDFFQSTWSMETAEDEGRLPTLFMQQEVKRYKERSRENNWKSLVRSYPYVSTCQ